MANPRRGQCIELHPVSYTTWEAWQGIHPDTMALNVPADPNAFTLDRMAIVLTVGTDAAGFDYRDPARG